MHKAILKINHIGCWGSEISLKFPNYKFSSIDVRWIKNSVAHILKIIGGSEKFDLIFDYLKKRKDVKNLEILSKNSDEMYLRTITKSKSSHPSFSNKFFEMGCFPVSPTRFEKEFEVWTLGTNERASIKKVYNLIKKKYPCKLSYLKEEKLRSSLTEKQRYAYSNAKYFGYYDWPRKKSATEIAKILGISKTVFFSHLRKAEIKLLNQIE